MLLLIPYPKIDPVLVDIGPLPIRWYALAYIAGIIFGWAYVRHLVGKDPLWGKVPHPSRASIDDLVVYVAFGIILGGRLGYVLFYNLPVYLAHPLEIFAVWKGGMSFHGGLLGAMLGIILFARRVGVPVLAAMDPTAASVPIGLALGRLANFIKPELWGRPTDVPWAMIFPGSDGRCRAIQASFTKRASKASRCSSSCALRDTPRRTQTAGADDRAFRARLWHGADHLRILPRAGPAARLSLRRRDNGHAALAAADPGRARAHPLRDAEQSGVTRAGAGNRAR